MKFSTHIGKAVWAFSSRGLPLVYAIALIMVARAFSPEQFGVLSVFQTLFTVLFTFSDGFALQAIVKFGVEPDTPIEELVSVTLLLFLAVLGSALTIIGIFPGVISEVLHIPQLQMLIPYFILLAIVTMPRVVFSKVLQSRFRMREIFFIDCSNFGLASLAIYCLIPLGLVHSAEDVIRITIISGAISSLVATILVRPYLSFRFAYSRAIAKRISQFVRYQAAMGIVSTTQQNFDTLVVSGFTGAAGAGIYNSAKMLFRGFDIVRETMTLFVFPASSKYYSRGDDAMLRTIVEKSTSFLFLIILPAAIILEFGAPLIFHILYGAKYDVSIPIFRVLLIAALFFPIQMVFNVTMTGMGKIRESFRMFTITFIVNAALATTLLALTHSLISAAVAFVIATGVQTWQLYRYLKRAVIFDSKKLISRGIGDTLMFLNSVRKRADSIH